MTPESFRLELQRLLPNGDLRLVRDPRRLLMDLWVVERRVPRQEYVAGLERLQQSGEPRFVHIELDGTGRYYDVNPEWLNVHTCKSAACTHDLPIWHGPECYREPDMRDIHALHCWLYGFRDFEHSRVELQREQRDRQADAQADATFNMTKEIRSSKDFRQLVYSMPNDGHGSTTERINEKV